MNSGLALLVREELGGLSGNLALGNFSPKTKMNIRKNEKDGKNKSEDISTLAQYCIIGNVRTVNICNTGFFERTDRPKSYPLFTDVKKNFPLFFH